MKTTWSLFVAVAMATAGGWGVAMAADEARAGQWETEVAAVAARVAAQAPGPGGVVFAGSSSIRLWHLDESFSGLGAINVGFGGSQIADNTVQIGRLIVPWRPACVVFYAGDNDIAAGRPPEQVVRDFVEFATTLHGALPTCRLVFLSIKPSPSRWKFWPQVQAANAGIRRLCDTVGGPRLEFVDVGSVLLGPNGEPRPELFLDDQLHLNAAGYAAWTARLKERLGKGREGAAVPPLKVGG